MNDLELAILFHHAYERLAPSVGYDTRVETRIFDPESLNGKLMLAVCAEILPLFPHPPAPTTQEPVATHDVGSGGYSVLDCPHCLRTIHIKTVHPPAPTQREHITDGSPCWCSPDLDYVDPETGAKVWIHKNIQ